MSKREKGWIGVDLGTRAVKLAQVRRVDARLRLTAAAVIRRRVQETDAGDHPADSRADWSATELRAGLTTQARFHGRKAACTLPMSETELRALHIPEGTSGQRRAMIAGELSRVLGGTVDEHEFDFWETDVPGEPDREDAENVNALYVSHETIERVTRPVAGAGLRCEVLDGLPTALARAVQMSGGTQYGKTVGAIDWGFTTATFSIIGRGRALFSRRLRDCGYGRWIGDVSRGLNLTPDDAQQLLGEYGLGGSDLGLDSSREAHGELTEAIADLVAEPLAEMEDQLIKTVTYLQIHRPALVPDSYCLCGGGATTRGVTDALTQRLGRPVRRWSLPRADHQSSPDDGPPVELLAGAVALSALAFSG